MTDPTSLEIALARLRSAVAAIEDAETELRQLDRCLHNDYPSGAPPSKRCTLTAGHEGHHLYPERHWQDGGKRLDQMTAAERIEAIRGAS